MNDNISNIKLQFTCTENWDAMPGAEGGRHCDKCQKMVYDFTNSKADEFRQIMAENNGKVCGRFTSQQVASITATMPVWKRWLSAAIVLIGFNIWSENAAAQNARQKIAKDTTTSNGMPPVPQPSPQSDMPSETDTLIGSVEALPEFPGGNKRLEAFIEKNTDRTKAKHPVTIQVTFIIEKDGALSEVHAIGKITDTSAAEEAVRVMKLSPKWNPGSQNGKLVRVQYTVPFTFN